MGWKGELELSMSLVSYGFGVQNTFMRAKYMMLQFSHSLGFQALLILPWPQAPKDSGASPASCDQ